MTELIPVDEYPQIVYPFKTRVAWKCNSCGKIFIFDLEYADSFHQTVAEGVLERLFEHKREDATAGRFEGSWTVLQGRLPEQGELLPG